MLLGYKRQAMALRFIGRGSSFSNVLFSATLENLLHTFLLFALLIAVTFGGVSRGISKELERLNLVFIRDPLLLWRHVHLFDHPARLFISDYLQPLS